MNFKRLCAGIIASAIIIPVLLMTLSIPSMADSTVEISSTNFTDANFREYVKQFDTNGDNKLSEAERKAVKSINVSNESHKISWGAGAGTVKLDSEAKTIRYLKGIEYFTELETLNIVCNPNLTSVDLSQNTKLKTLIAHNTGLKSIDLTSLPLLENLRIWNTNLSSIYIGDNPNLTYIDISLTNINTVNVSRATGIKNAVTNGTPSEKVWNNWEYTEYTLNGSTLNINAGATVVTSTPSNTTEVSKENFPDNNIRMFIFENVDINHDALLSQSEITECKKIEISDKSFSSLDGLELLTNLSSLKLSNSKANSIDISALPYLKSLIIFNCPNITSVDINNNPYLIEAYKSYNRQNGDCYLSVGSVKVILDGNTSPDGYSMFAMWKPYSEHHLGDHQLINDTSLKVFESTTEISVSNVKIPTGGKITATIMWNGKIAKTINITNDTTIKLDSDIVKQFDPSYTSSTPWGHYDVTFTTSSNYVLYDFDLDAFERNDYRMSLADTYLDTGKYYFDTDTVTVYVPPEYRDVVASYSMCETWYFPSESVFLTGNYNGEEYLIIKIPDKYKVNGFASTSALSDCVIELRNSDGFVLTTLYPTILNSFEPNLYIDLSASSHVTMDENGIYHATDVEYLPIRSPMSYDDFRTELYFNDQLIGYSYYAWLGTIDYGTEAALSRYGFKYDTYNGYLYPGTYHMKVWLNRLDYLIGEITFEVSATGFDASTAAKPNLPTVEKPVLNPPTVTPADTPTGTPTGTPNGTPNGTPTGTPNGTPTGVPGTNNGGNSGASNNSSPTPTIPTAAPTKAPELSIGDFVKRCYNVALGREPDEGGFNYWVDNLNNGSACGAQVGYGFIFSQEYINKNRTNEEFVTDLYSMYFGRTPDSEGFKYWVDKLNAGEDRENIFAGFANSLEFYNLCTKYGVVQGLYIVGVPNDIQGGVNCFVARMYSVCLNRLPDMEGQSGWVLKLMNGEVTGTSLSYGFVFSPEFIGNNPSKGEFVACMYRAFFGREPDQDGFNSWVSVLAFGGSYEDVFNGFTGSLEFANLCNSYGINP